MFVSITLKGRASARPLVVKEEGDEEMGSAAGHINGGVPGAGSERGDGGIHRVPAGEVGPV